MAGFETPTSFHERNTLSVLRHDKGLNIGPRRTELRGGVVAASKRPAGTGRARNKGVITEGGGVVPGHALVHLRLTRDGRGLRSELTGPM